MDLFAGRYALRYGKVASEAIKKQMAQIPGGLVSYLLPCNTALLRITIYVIIIWSVLRSFLANVNSRSRSLYAIARPSVVCLSYVTFVRPTQAVQILGNISMALGT